MIEIPPRFHILSPSEPPPRGGVAIVLQPSGAFGDGKHETTQLCLQALSAFAPRDGRAWRVLDFGSGSGILSIAAARLGAVVVGVEIDAAAVTVARESAKLNGVDSRVSFATALDEGEGRFDVVVANILRGVLIDMADDLVARVATGGTLVLSGLVGTDVPEIVARYGAKLEGRRAEVYARGEWRAVVWRPMKIPLPPPLPLG